LATAIRGGPQGDAGEEGWKTGAVSGYLTLLRQLRVAPNPESAVGNPAHRATEAPCYAVGKIAHRARKRSDAAGAETRRARTAKNLPHPA